jgi:uncharacterized protein YukE
MQDERDAYLQEEIEATSARQHELQAQVDSARSEVAALQAEADAAAQALRAFNEKEGGAVEGDAEERYQQVKQQLSEAMDRCASAVLCMVQHG